MSNCVICGEGPLLLDEFYRCRVCRKEALEQRHKGDSMNATCGHEDALGFLTGTPCAKCVKTEHAKATGRKTA